MPGAGPSIASAKLKMAYFIAVKGIALIDYYLVGTWLPDMLKMVCASA